MSTNPQSPKVLVVDDCENSLAVISHLFQGAGATVTSCLKGEEALEEVKAIAAKNTFFDLVVVDIRMPDISGNALAAQIRQLGHEVPIIAFTATATAEGRKKSASSGIDAYFGKATLKKDLVKALLENIPSLRDQAKQQNK